MPKACLARSLACPHQHLQLCLPLVLADASELAVQVVSDPLRPSLERSRRETPLPPACVRECVGWASVVPIGPASLSLSLAPSLPLSLSLSLSRSSNRLTRTHSAAVCQVLKSGRSRPSAPQAPAHPSSCRTLAIVPLPPCLAACAPSAVRELEADGHHLASLGQLGCVEQPLNNWVGSLRERLGD
jgi:hypothetical protein